MATEEGTPPQHPLVFINYKTCRLRSSFFVSRLVRVLKRNRVNVFEELNLMPETPIENIFKVIEESRIALVIFWSMYTESEPLLEELVRIKELVEEGKLVVIPVFYKVKVSEVKHLTGKFGANFRDLEEGISYDKIEKWKEALDFVSQKNGFVYNDLCDSKTNFIYSIVEQVVFEITRISPKQIESSHDYCMSELQEDSSMDSSRSEDLKGVAREIDGILLDTKTDGDPMEAEIVQPEAKSRRDEGLNLTKDDNVLGETNSSSTVVKLPPNQQVAYMSTPLTVVEKVPKVVEYIPAERTEIPRDNSTVVELPPNHQMLRYGIVSHVVKTFESCKITSQLGMIIACLLLLFFCLQHIAYMSTHVTGEGGVIDRVVENVPKVIETEILQTISSEGSQKAYVDPSNIDTDTSAGSEKDTNFGVKQRMKELGDKFDLNKITSQLGMIIACLLLFFFRLQHVAYISTPVTGEGGVIDRVVENVPKVKPPNIQVFINFRGKQLRKNFVAYLVAALRGSGINVFIDNQEQRGEDLNTLFKRIEDSGIAIVVFSSRYTESKWCLDELVKIQERVDQGLLKVIPLYFKVTPDNVKKLNGDFGDHFRNTVCMNKFDKPKIKRWKEAIRFVSHRHALDYDEKSSMSENEFVEKAVKEVLKTLQAISTAESGQSSR